MAWRNDQVSRAETEQILALARESCEVLGDFAEFGCYKGDTSLLLAEVLRGSAKKLYLYDSFEGLPEKGEADESPLGVDFKAGELFTTKRELKQRFLRAGLSLPVIHKGWFEDLTGEDVPGKLAFCFVDGDLYSSTLTVLKLVEERLVPGSVILVHDYRNPALPGVEKAADEWLKSRFNYTTEVVESMLVVKMGEKGGQAQESLNREEVEG